MNDYIIRATAAEDCIRLFAATTTNLVQKAHDAHNTSNVATAALGRLLTGGAIMGSMLKNETDVMTLQIDGAGPIKDVTHYYYSGEFDENLGNVYYTPYFMTRSYNVGARNYYEEFLFNKGSLVFYFCKSQNDETRYYWGAGGFFHEDIKGQKQMDEVFASRLAHDLVEAFNRLMNREY